MLKTELLKLIQRSESGVRESMKVLKEDVENMQAEVNHNMNREMNLKFEGYQQIIDVDNKM
jgi:hypothetical protein